MIKVEKLSYSFPDKELYQEISFTLEDGVHCAFIGSNGTGKSTLVSMLQNPKEYLYDGKIERDANARIGYVSQFAKREDEGEQTVFAFLSETFVTLQSQIAAICEQMGTAEDLDSVFEEYQKLLDLSDAIDADNYESNIRKRLKVAGFSQYENRAISKLSGGEYKLLQVMKEMLLLPELLIMDEPDVYLDFENLNALCNLINNHKGTMLVITHNRYLLNHCFNKILHLEDKQIQEFDGNYVDYHFSLLLKKMELQELAKADMDEIERNQKLVEKLRADATKFADGARGRALRARVTMLNRLEERRIKAPFVELRQPEISFHTGKENQPEEIENSQDTEENQSTDKKVLLRVKDYEVSFDDLLLEHVDFEIKEGEKVALVGPNGTGKTTLLREIFHNNNKAIETDADTRIGFLSQIQGETLAEEHTPSQEFEELGFEKDTDIEAYLEKYCFPKESIYQRIKNLSGGEKNLLQIAKLGAQDFDFLMLDEPTSHLDTYAQMALEKAIADYPGTVLMVSHDFYTIVNCVDYVLYVEDKTIRRMSNRAFRKMIYANHFDKDYLELEQKKKEFEVRIEAALRNYDYETAGKLSVDLEEIIKKMAER